MVVFRFIVNQKRDENTSRLSHFYIFSVMTFGVTRVRSYLFDVTSATYLSMSAIKS